MIIIEVCCNCYQPAPRPLLICTKCSEGVDQNGNIAPAIYCDTKCRANHDHEQDCDIANMRKQLYRAGDLLQSIFYKFREAAYDVRLEKVVKKGDILHVYEGGYLFVYGCGPIYEFPDEMVSEWADKAVLLTFCACEDAVAFMHELSKILLEGITLRIAELVLDVDPSYCALVRYYDGVRQEDVCSHTVLLVEGHDNREYMVDMAGAQYRQHRAVVPGGTYTPMQRSEDIDRRAFGREAEVFVELSNGRKDYSNHDMRSIKIQFEAVRRLMQSIKQWECKNETTLQKLLRGSRTKYEELGKESLLRDVSIDLDEFLRMDRLESTRLHKLWSGRKMHP